MDNRHNGGPPLLALDGGAFRAWVKHITDRTDLSGKQKLIAICIAVDANPDWQSEVRNTDLQRMAGARDRETVFEATKVLLEKGVLSREKRPGYASRYTILPPSVIESIVAAYNARQGVVGENPTKVLPENPTTPYNTEGVVVGKNPTTPLGENPTTSTPVVGINPTTSGREISAHPVKPDGFFPTSQPSPAYSYNNLLTSLVEIPVSEEITPLPPKRRKRKAPEAVADRHDVLKAYEGWNELALRCGLPQATTLTPKRVESIGARLRECGGLEAWATALSNIEKSAFLCGETDRDFRASLDFLIQPSSFVKVLEGTYGNGRHRENKPKRTMVDVSSALAARFRNGGA